MEFDDTIRVGSGNAAVANATGASVLDGAASAHGHVLTIPLRPRLAGGAYSIRWSIVSDDGHREQGVLAFAVGSGGAVPRSVLGAANPLSASGVFLRALYYLGLLAGAGAAAFGLFTRGLLGDRLRRPLSHLLFVSLLLAFIGASGIVHSATAGTRFALVLKVALTVALVGGAAAALAPMYRQLLLLASACALALIAAPTLSGHALDPDQPRILSAAIDLAHGAAAAIWIGGLVALLYAVPRASNDERARIAVTRRFSAIALVAVVVLAASGLGRALTELRSVSQLWSTSYGQALIVKTLLFVPLLGIGWLNRVLLIRMLALLRRSMLVEVTVIGCIVAVVAVLTQLRPGKEAPRTTSASAPLQAAQPPVLPPQAAVVDARELGSSAVAVGRTPGQATVTLIGPDGTGASGHEVLIDDRAAVACGAGCYRGPAGPGTLLVTVDGRSLSFDIPARAPDGERLLARITRAYRSSRSIVFDESLASSPSNVSVTRFELVAPNRLSYRIHGGPQAIVIGSRRWDRDRPSAPWLESPQTPLDVTQPYWRNPTNVHLIAPGTLTFLARDIPAWFHVTVDARARLPARVAMTAPAHFMVARYRSYDGPVVVSPPSR